MRALAGSLALALALGSGVWAQRGMGGGFRGGGGGGFRGGGGMGGVHRGGGFVGGGFGHGGAFVGTGGFHNGIGFHAGVGRFGFGRFGRFNNAAFVSPWGWGWGWGWPGWGWGWDNSFGSYPSYVADYGYGYPSMAYGYGGGYNYSQPASAPVVISQSFSPATPVIHEYPDWGGAASSPPSPPPAGDMPQPAGQAQGPVIYLIAFNDGVIRPALAYWTTGATLNYLGMDHRQKQAALGSVDRNFSAQLNRERRVPFSLPQ